MRRFYGYSALAAAMVVGLAMMVAAQPPAGGQGMRGQGQGMRGQGPGPGGGPMAALKLTDEQQQQLRTLMQTERGAHQAEMEHVRELRKQLHGMVYGGGGDGAAALALATEIATIEAKARIPMQMAAAAILTPEQRSIVIESGMAFPPAQMGPGGPGGRGGRGGQAPGKK